MGCLFKQLQNLRKGGLVWTGQQSGSERIRNSFFILEGNDKCCPLVQGNLLTSILCVCETLCESGEAFVLEVLLKSAGSKCVLQQPAGTAVNLRTPLDWDEECEVRANAIAKAD